MANITSGAFPNDPKYMYIYNKNEKTLAFVTLRLPSF